MSNGPIVLTEDGSNIFWAHEAWHDYCSDHNIKDPWVLMRKCENKINKTWKEINDKGHEITHIDFHPKNEWPADILKEYQELEKYRDQYMCDREIWEGKYILKNFGYNTLIKFAQTHSKSKTASKSDKAFNDWFAKIYPCEGKERQCNFACPVFNNCPYHEQGIYRSGVDFQAVPGDDRK